MNLSVERILGALIAAAILAFAGYVVGEYHPFTGGFLASIAQPFSPARNNIADGYAVVGGIIGVILGLMITPSAKKTE